MSGGGLHLPPPVLIHDGQTAEAVRQHEYFGSIIADGTPAAVFFILNWGVLWESLTQIFVCFNFFSLTHCFGSFAWKTRRGSEILWDRAVKGCPLVAGQGPQSRAAAPAIWPQLWAAQAENEQTSSVPSSSVLPVRSSNFCSQRVFWCVSLVFLLVFFFLFYSRG